MKVQISGSDPQHNVQVKASGIEISDRYNFTIWVREFGNEEIDHIWVDIPNGSFDISRTDEWAIVFQFCDSKGNAARQGAYMMVIRCKQKGSIERYYLTKDRKWSSIPMHRALPNDVLLIPVLA